MKSLSTTLALIVGLLSSISAWARPVVITDLAIQSMASDQVQVRLAFDGPAPEVRSYTVDDPARIAIDLEQTGSALDKRYFQVGSKAVRGVTVIESAGRTRLIVNLAKLMPFDVAREGNRLTLALGGEASVVSAQAPVPM